MSSPCSITKQPRNSTILCKNSTIFVTIGLVFFLFFFLFVFSSNQRYINTQPSNNILFRPCDPNRQEKITAVGSPPPPPTNLSHLMFVLVGSSRAWKKRRTYIESWWRPNVTRGNLFLDVEPTQPWPQTSPPYQINEDIKKLKIYPKLKNPIHIRIYRSILETHRLKNDEGIRWYVMGDDDSLFFVDNIVDVLAGYDHTDRLYVGMNSETIRSNFAMSFGMAYGGAGYALSFPLVEALVKNLDDCIERYHFIWAGDQLQSFCLADLGVDLITERGFHQMDLRGDLSGLLSSHPTSPLLSLHHFEWVEPLFPSMDRTGSVSHLMKAANVDQSRMLQQSICHFRQNNWTFAVSWGYSAHIYENVFPRSHLMRPIETFSPWVRGRAPVFTFNTRGRSQDPCETPHWFFFNSIEGNEEKNEVVTSYTRTFPRNMTSCSFTGNHSADPIAKIQLFSPKTRKEARRVECCDVEYAGADVANIRLRNCEKDKAIA